jgi:hypothetical protein
MNQARSVTALTNWFIADDEGAAGAEVTGSGQVVTTNAEVVAC